MNFKRLSCIIIGLSVLIKIPALFHPLIGYFSSYQTMNAMMGEMMLRGHWFDPRTFIIYHGVPALHLLYYPFGALAAALLQNVAGGDIAVAGRFQAILFMTGASFFYLPVILSYAKRAHFPNPERTALLSTLFFVFAPFNLILGIQFQNEASAVFFLLAAVFFAHQYQGAVCAFISGLAFSLSFVARLHFVFLAPIFLFLYGKRLTRITDLFFFSIGGLLPTSAWILYFFMLQKQFPNDVMTSLFSQSQEGRILKQTVFGNVKFYIQLLKTFSGPMLTPIGLLLTLIGLFRFRRTSVFFSLWLVFALCPILLLPQKVWDHPFYIIAAIPPMSFFAACGAESVMKKFTAKFVFLLIGLFFLLTLRYYIPPAFSNDGGEAIPRIGREVQNMIPQSAYVIAERGTTPDLLFYSQRMGWAFDLQMAEHPLDGQPRHRELLNEGYGDPIRWLEKLRRDNARFFLLSSVKNFYAQKKFSDYVESRYRRISDERKDFILFDLGVTE